MSKEDIVMGIYMHCQGCANLVTKSLKGFEGVEEIKADVKNHKVTVKGKNADPKNVFDRLKKKTGKHVILISPRLKDKKEEKKETKKEEPKIIEVVLKMYMHCEGCGKDIKSLILKMNGVQTVTPDWKNCQVTVKGTFEPAKLVEYVKKKGDKHVNIAKQTQTQTQTRTATEGKKGGTNDKEKQGKKTDIHAYYQVCPPGLVYAPQLFSDENPNACSIM